MFSEELEVLIDAALAGGEITEKSRAILHKRAQAEGVDTDELDMVIDARLSSKKNEVADNKSEKVTALQQLLNNINKIHGTEFKKGIIKSSTERKVEALVDAIRSFQIPNEKDELLEVAQFLLPYSKSNAWTRSQDTTVDEDVAKAYKDRFKEVEAKIKSQFSDDFELMEAIGANKKKGLLGKIFGK